MRIRFAATALITLALTLPAAAGAAVDWAAPVPLSTPTVDASEGVLSVNEQGRAVAAWSEASGNGVVVVSVRDARGWSAPLVVSAADHAASSPAVSIDPQGTAIVVWSESGPGGQGDGTYARVRSPGGTWGPAATVSSDTSGARVIMDSAGRATVVQLHGSGFNPGDGLFARRRALDGTWEDAKRVSPAMRTGAIRLAVDLAGDVTVGWGAQANTEVWVNERGASGGDWGTPVQLATGNASALTLAKSPLTDSTAIGACAGPTPCTLTLWTRAVGTTTWVSHTPLTRSAAVPPNLQVVGVGPAPLGGDQGGYLAANILTTTAGDVFGTWTGEAATSVAGTLAANQEARAIIVGTTATGFASSDLYPGGTWSAAAPIATIAGLTTPRVLGLGVDRAGRGTLLYEDQGEESGAPRRIFATLGAGTDPDPNPPGGGGGGGPVPPAPPAPPAPAGPAPTPGTPAPQAAAPGAKASGATTQTAGSAVAVTVSCPDAACVVDASGTLSVPGAAKTYKLTGVRGRRVAAGRKATLKLRLSRAQRAAARRALGRHAKVSVRVRITVRPAAGGAAKTLTRTIKLKR